MDDYSKSALGGRGREQQERMRVFLECEKGPRDEAPYDFTKGRVKFEYKYSGLHKRNKNLKKKPHCAPIKTWSFQELMGDGRRKRFDYLILEGNDQDEARSYYFLIGFEELAERGASTLTVTVPALGGGRKRGLRGLSKRGVSKFVWDHLFTKDDLKKEVDRLALAYDRARNSTGVPRELDDLHRQTELRVPPKIEPSRKRQSARSNSDSQLWIPFESK